MQVGAGEGVTRSVYSVECRVTSLLLLLHSICVTIGARVVGKSVKSPAPVHSISLTRLEIIITSSGLIYSF